MLIADILRRVNSERTLSRGGANFFQWTPKQLERALPSSMKVFGEIGRPLETYYPHDRSKLLWWFLRFAVAVEGNLRKAGVGVLRSILEIFNKENWTQKGARDIALDYSAIHAAASLFADVNDATLKYETCEWDGFVDCVPGLRYLHSELNLDPCEQQTWLSVAGEKLFCFERTVSRAATGDKVVAVRLAVGETPSQTNQFLIPSVEIVMRGGNPLCVRSVGLDDPSVLKHSEYFAVFGLKESLQARLSVSAATSPTPIRKKSLSTRSLLFSRSGLLSIRRSLHSIRSWRFFFSVLLYLLVVPLFLFFLCPCERFVWQRFARQSTLSSILFVPFFLVLISRMDLITSFILNPSVTVSDRSSLTDTQNN